MASKILAAVSASAAMMDQANAKEYFVATVRSPPYGYDRCNAACAYAGYIHGLGPTGARLVSCISDQTQYDELVKILSFRSVFIGLRQNPDGKEPSEGWLWDNCIAPSTHPIQWHISNATARSQPDNGPGYEDEDCAAILFNHCEVNGRIGDVHCTSAVASSGMPKDCLCEADGKAPPSTVRGLMEPDQCSWFTNHIAKSHCSVDYCTSPGFSTELKQDCWAGTDIERCTCSKGTAKLTGNQKDYEGYIYHQYTCCTEEPGEGETYVGEVCGSCCSEPEELRHNQMFAIMLSASLLAGCIGTLLGLCVCYRMQCCCWKKAPKEKKAVAHIHGTEADATAQGAISATVVGTPVATGSDDSGKDGKKGQVDDLGGGIPAAFSDFAEANKV